MIYVVLNSVSREASLILVRSIYCFSKKVSNFNVVAEYIMTKHSGFLNSHFNTGAIIDLNF